MIPFAPFHRGSGSGAESTQIRLLVIGAHSDDIEIGAGGTLLSMLDAGVVERLDWLVLSADGDRHEEAEASAQRCLGRVAEQSLTIADLPERHFHAAVHELKRAVASAVASSEPDVVIGPALHDVHQDHRATAEAIRQACRNNVVLEYEICKFEGDLRTPNFYVPLDDDVIDRKLAWLRESFPSQHGRQWFDDELFRGLARVRGVECVSRYAEGFHCRKLVFAPGCAPMEAAR